jgi:hypothetical protein
VADRGHKRSEILPTVIILLLFGANRSIVAAGIQSGS